VKRTKKTESRQVIRTSSFRSKSGRLILRPAILTQVVTQPTGTIAVPRQGVLGIPEPTTSVDCPLARRSKKHG